ncbi:MAG: FAD-binding protein, partial [Pseudomonadota bacterium]
LDSDLKSMGAGVKRNTQVETLQIESNGCEVSLSSGEEIRAKYVIGADGSRSTIRNQLKIPFEITRPQIVWAVIDGVVNTDFEKVPEIIVFQAETSDVAWIPREGNIDRFYVRMDTKEFTFDEAVAKINRAMQPKTLAFDEVVWFSQFSVKESVAESFSVENRVFLAGDSCHIHSVNGGQGLNTGLADAFNLIWKLNMVEKFGLSKSFLETYEEERKPVALSVIETSGELVRRTKYSETGTHANDYVEAVQRRAGNITGMGIGYGESGGLKGQRLFDLELHGSENADRRIYSLLDYTKYSLITFGEPIEAKSVPENLQILNLGDQVLTDSPQCRDYAGKILLVRPDSYIQDVITRDEVESLLKNFKGRRLKAGER